MKAFKFLSASILLISILLSACTAAPASQKSASVSSVGSDKPLSEVTFTGVIESMNGNQWVINGQTVSVDSSTSQEGSFLVGDTVKVEAHVAADGSVTAKSVESPAAADLAETATSTPEPIATGSPVVSDNNGNEAVGAVEAISDTSITMGGQTYTFAPGVEIKGSLEVGAIVKLHFVTNADGSLSVTEVEIANPTEVSNNNGSDDNSNDVNVNESSSNDTNVNDNSSNENSDDNSNVNSNDDDDHDNGNASSNDDNGGDENGNDNSSNDNSNDSPGMG